MSPFVFVCLHYQLASPHGSGEAAEYREWLMRYGRTGFRSLVVEFPAVLTADDFETLEEMALDAAEELEPGIKNRICEYNIVSWRRLEE